MHSEKMKTATYAKKLKARLKELQEKRKKDLKQFERDTHVWRGSLLTWLRTAAVTRIEDIKVSEIKDKYRRSDQPGFNTHRFFDGAPQPPIYPTDKIIREIQRKIQYLAIIYAKEVHVTEEEVGRFFGMDPDED